MEQKEDKKILYIQATSMRFELMLPKECDIGVFESHTLTTPSQRLFALPTKIDLHILEWTTKISLTRFYHYVTKMYK
jgi:hypothetical protein